MTKMENLMSQLAEAKKKAQQMIDEGKKDEAAEAVNKVKEIIALIDQQKVLDGIEKEEMQKKSPEGEPKAKRDAIKDFAAAARHGFPKNATKMSEGVPADGGYTVPEDIETIVREKRSAKVSLLNLISSESVSAPSGRRTYKKRSQQTGFTKIGEGAKISASATPEFEVVNYTISKYAGYIPVTNELLEDSDERIVTVITDALAEDSRVTANKAIIEAATKEEAKEIKTVDDIKDILNVTLGQAYKPYSHIITNDDGLAWLDKLKDQNGRYLLSPIPSDPAKMQLAVGATVIPIFVVPNTDWASDDTKIPFIIGDIESAIKRFDRKGLTIATSDVATVGDFNAFEQDMTVFRGIERHDTQVIDSDAIVYATLDTAGG